jgi:hypothetical protein
MRENNGCLEPHQARETSNATTNHRYACRFDASDRIWFVGPIPQFHSRVIRELADRTSVVVAETTHFFANIA